MVRSHAWWWVGWAALLGCADRGYAEVVTPSRDSDVVQALPSGGAVSEERRLRRLWHRLPQRPW